jgi:STE24 endopeptidase
MPLTLLLALFLAFGFDETVVGQGGVVPRPPAVLWSRVSETVGGVLLVAVVAFLLGRVVARRVERQGRASPLVRRAYSIGARAVDVLSLVVYGWIIRQLEWPHVVRALLGMGDPILIDDALTLLPFLLAQAAGWWGVYAAERALRAARGTGHTGGLRRHLWLKARQSLGMVLPAATVYGLGTDLVHRIWPATLASPWDQPLSLALMGVLVLTLAPALVRIALPTRSLPPGPLRERLEHLAHRVGFRCTDILMWDTNQVIVNAGVTGSLPWFRYVLLTDALVENLSPYEVAAVFGHEIGHIAHRHLLFFGFFLLGSLGLMATADGFLRQVLDGLSLPLWITGGTTALVLEVVATLVLVGGYFLVVFGHVSRRFERQADVFGCRAVSCGLPDCPPHADLDSHPGPVTAEAHRGAAMPLCPMGIRIFVTALSNVALLNGMRPSAWSWRHGSILRRITFLEGLEGRPEVERSFQKGVKRMRLGMAVVLIAAVGLAVAQGYLR